MPQQYLEVQLEHYTAPASAQLIDYGMLSWMQWTVLWPDCIDE